eukprot:1153777-Pelagomonas_calceolata.AAC.2
MTLWSSSIHKLPYRSKDAFTLQSVPDGAVICADSQGLDNVGQRSALACMSTISMRSFWLEPACKSGNPTHKRQKIRNVCNPFLTTLTVDQLVNQWELRERLFRSLSHLVNPLQQMRVQPQVVDAPLHRFY